MTYVDIAAHIKRLSLNERLHLMETLTRSLREDLKSVSARPRFVVGPDLLALAGTLPSDDARDMREAIEPGCEQVDVREW
jgi:hypothetical protein